MQSLVKGKGCGSEGVRGREEEGEGVRKRERGEEEEA